MKVASLDCETTILYNASAYAVGNKDGLVCWSWTLDDVSYAKKWAGPKEVQELVDSVDLVVGANFKFDVGWFRVNGVDIKTPVWDVLIAEFLIGRQLQKFPSLNYCCEKYGIPLKLDVVKTEYWAKGIDTCEVPWEILSEYAAHDAAVTLQVYYKQLPLMTPAMIKLCKLMSQDLFVLQDMEMNGLLFDEQLCELRSQACETEIQQITLELEEYVKPITTYTPTKMA